MTPLQMETFGMEEPTPCPDCGEFFELQDMTRMGDHDIVCRGCAELRAFEDEVIYGEEDE